MRGRRHDTTIREVVNTIALSKLRVPWYNNRIVLHLAALPEVREPGSRFVLPDEEGPQTSSRGSIAGQAPAWQWSHPDTSGESEKGHVTAMTTMRDSRVITLAEPLRILTPEQVSQIDRYLADLEEFGRLTLIKRKGELRFIERTESMEMLQSSARRSGNRSGVEGV